VMNFMGIGGYNEALEWNSEKSLPGAIRSYVRSVKRGGSKERVAPGKLLQNL
jgi:hypothetical protein